MSRGPRLLVIALAVVAAALAFAIARPSDDDDGGDRAAGTTTAPPAETATAEERTPPPEEAPKPTYERVRVRGGQPVGGVKKVTAEKGDTVRLAVSSDAPAEVHVHGYDIVKEVAAGGTARFRFAARIEGIFEVELEGPHTQIAELTVEP